MATRTRICLTAWIGLIGTGLASGPPARAFERSRDPYTGACLHHQERRVAFRVTEGCEVGGSRRACLQAVRDAFDRWNRVPCSDIRIELAGTTALRRIEADVENPEQNLNLIVLSDLGSLVPEIAEAPKSFSTTTYDRLSGRIIDNDIELNYVGTDVDADDLHDILVHEVGHALGFSHVKDSSAVMYAYRHPGPGRLSLSQDDIDAICHVYPAGHPTPSCRPEPSSHLAGWQPVGQPSGFLLVLLGMGCAALVWRFRTRGGFNSCGRKPGRGRAAGRTSSRNRPGR